MTMQEYEQDLEIFREATDLYYNTSTPIMSDEDYDKLKARLLAYEEEHNLSEVSDTIGAKPKGTSVKHKKPMLSMDNVFDVPQLEQWLENGKTYTAELKYDGVSGSISYKNGKIDYMATRGDGDTGSDITKYKQHINGLPQTLDEFTFEVRGEFVITHSDLKRVNAYRVEHGKEILKNPRNAVIGALGLDSIKEFATRRVSFVPWGLLGTNIKSHSEKMKFLKNKNVGIRSKEYRVTTDDKVKILEFYEKVVKERANIPYEVDGVIVRLDSEEEFESKGYTATAPRGAIAFKLPYTARTTVLRDIVWQTSRAGVITPVGVVKGVDIAGADVTRVTLYNISEIERLDLHFGDTVIITRSGDVIPKLIGISKTQPRGTKKVLPPEECPECKQKTSREGAVIVCNNTDCGAKSMGKLLHYGSRDGADIDGLGISTIRTLGNMGVKNIYSLYAVSEEALRETFGDKIGIKLFRNIRGSVELPLDKFIFGLGLKDIGKQQSKAIADKFGLTFLNMTYDSLISIDGFGDKTIDTLLRELKRRREEIKLLLLEIKPKPLGKIDGSLEDVNVAITGTHDMSRKDIVSLIEKNGGTYASSITGSTNVLISDKKNSTKDKQAKEKGIVILTLEAFKDLIS